MKYRNSECLGLPEWVGCKSLTQLASAWLVGGVYCHNVSSLWTVMAAYIGNDSGWVTPFFSSSLNELWAKTKS